MAIRKIVSGGQTGVDRGALDGAIRTGISHGGWCPFARRAEDGVIPARYQLTETGSPQYRVRTEQNVIDSDGTLVLYCGHIRGGTKLTVRAARQHGKPLLVVDLHEAPDVGMVRDWVKEHDIGVLNVAGPRESQSPGIGAEAEAFVGSLLSE